MEKVFEHAVKYHYLRKGDHYTLSALGTLLMDNIRAEWYTSIIRSQEESILKIPKTSPETYRQCLELNKKKLPLGLVNMESRDFQYSKKTGPGGSDLNMHFFTNPSTETQWFDHWLRARRAWWVKLLREPESVSQGASDEGSNSLELNSPAGKFKVETLSRVQGEFFTDEPKVTINGRKPVLPSVLKSSFSSHEAFLAILADGLASRPLNRKEKVLHICPHLAPWKVAIVLPSEKEVPSQQLRQFSRVLSSQLKEARISVAPPTLGAGANYAWLDGAGIPFSVQVTEEALTTGICGLRSRDTTISEQVHVSNLRQYLLKFLMPFLG